MSASAVVVMPRGPSAWPTAEALWITARGWADAAAARFGTSWIVTPDGAWSPAELPRPARPPAAPRSPRPPVLPLAPLARVARTLAKDAALWRRQRRFQVAASGPWAGTDLRLIWEHHDLFNRATADLGRSTGAPVVRYVHAPQVWEARKWGVARPLWGRLIEREEGRHLRSADLVACVSRQVAERVRGMGVEPGRVVVAPMAVDADGFRPDGPDARRRLGLDAAATVVGWSGSFRRFHGLDRLVDAFAAACGSASDLHLLLLGDGPERVALEARAADRGIAERVHFVGPVPHAEMPVYLRALDLAVVSSDARGGFHYSPLKLREYAACGLPVLAPREGELAELEDAGFVFLHPPGDPDALARDLVRLGGDPGRRAAAGTAARSHALRHWTWERQLDTVLARLGETAGRR